MMDASKIRLPVPSKRALMVVWTVVGLGTVVGLIVLTIFVLDLNDSRQQGRADRADLRSELVDTREDLSTQQAQSLNAATDAAALAEQVESLGEEPVVKPDAPTVSPRTPLVPIPGARGPAPTMLQVASAVSSLLGEALADACDGSCNGTDGVSPPAPADGKDGQSITGAQGGPGPKGDTGGTGAKGDTGDKGDKGDSVKGEDGRGIASLACSGSLTPLTLTLTYSDGTTAAVECGPTLEPTPEVAP